MTAKLNGQVNTTNVLIGIAIALGGFTLHEVYNMHAEQVKGSAEIMDIKQRMLQTESDVQSLKIKVAEIMQREEHKR